MSSGRLLLAFAQLNGCQGWYSMIPLVFALWLQDGCHIVKHQVQGRRKDVAAALTTALFLLVDFCLHPIY